MGSGDGPTVLLRADVDALPVREATGLPYVSTAAATDADGNEVPVAHACGHDVHVACLLGAAAPLADGSERWNGTLVALLQPAEETREALSHKGPTLLDVDVNPNEPPLPGKVEHGQAKKFTEAFRKCQPHRVATATTLFKDKIEQMKS